MILGRNNGRGIAWNFGAGAVFGPFAWVSVPYLRPFRKRVKRVPFHVVANARLDDIRAGREPRPFPSEQEAEDDPWVGSSARRKVIRNCFLLFFATWCALAWMGRLT